jgi:hypothetical protein
MKKLGTIVCVLFLCGCSLYPVPKIKVEVDPVVLEVQEDGFVCGRDTVRDADGNEYKTAYFDIEGGHDREKEGQCWMTENLNVGTVILDPDQEPSDNGVIEKWCPNHIAKNLICYMGGGGGKSPEKESVGCYDSPPSSTTNISEFCNGDVTKNIPAYGGLYTRREIFPKGGGSICPNAWDVPTSVDWDLLEKSIRKTITQQDLLNVDRDWGKYAWNMRKEIPIPTGWKFKKEPFNGLPQVKEGDSILNPLSVNFPGKSLETITLGNPGFQYELLSFPFLTPKENQYTMNYEEFKNSVEIPKWVKNPEAIWFSLEYEKYLNNLREENKQYFSVRCIKK